MLAHSLFFYFFSAIAVFSSVMVIISRNTVYSVFFLILVFVSISILFIMIGAEFLGMIMLIVYVGAVAVLFLFVVMMLNITEQESKKISRKGFIKTALVKDINPVVEDVFENNLKQSKLDDIGRVKEALQKLL